MKKLFMIISVFVAASVFASCGENVKAPETQCDTLEMGMDSTSVDSTFVSEKDSLIQCYANTKKGTRCERLCAYPDTLCFQHKKMIQ